MKITLHDQMSPDHEVVLEANDVQCVQACDSTGSVISLKTIYGTRQVNVSESLGEATEAIAAGVGR